jgi:hypothetical protein
VCVEATRKVEVAVPLTFLPVSWYSGWEGELSNISYRDGE